MLFFIYRKRRKFLSLLLPIFTESRNITATEFAENPVHILTSHIGVAATARFISYVSVGFGDYTEERKQIFDK
jgi:hypothetical protein